MVHEIEFRRSFHHLAWVDGVDRVSAAGDNGFNARFAAIEADLDSIGACIDDVSQALDDVEEETSAAVAASTRDGVAKLNTDSFPSPDDWSFVVPPEPSGQVANELTFRGGTAVLDGHAARLPVTPGGVTGARYRYSEQPWIDPVRAAADGVPVIAPLTTPTAERTDMVYLDVWDRPAAPGDASRRTVRETAVRVVEGAITVPTPLAGHRHLPLAALRRTAAQAVIASDQIEDRRPLIDATPRGRQLSIPVLFHPETFLAWSPWETKKTGTRVAAVKPAGLLCTGMVPVHLPNGSRINGLSVWGTATIPDGGSLFLRLELARSRTRTEQQPQDLLVGDTVTTPGPFVRQLFIPSDGLRNLAANFDFFYYFYAFAQPIGPVVEIHGVNVAYQM